MKIKWQFLWYCDSFQMGMCQSSTKYFYLQNPFFNEWVLNLWRRCCSRKTEMFWPDFSKSVSIEDIAPSIEVGTCSSSEVCRTSVSPNNLDSTSSNLVVRNCTVDMQKHWVTNYFCSMFTTSVRSFRVTATTLKNFLERKLLRESWKLIR